MDIKGIAATTCDRLGLLEMYGFLRRKATKSQVGILMYHRVCPSGDPWSLESLQPADFEKQVAYFCRGYEVLSLDQLIAYIYHGRSFPEKAVVITFDDGYRDNYLYAYPVIKKYGIPATIFLATGYIGRDALFWWDEVRYIIHNSVVLELDVDVLGGYSLRSPADRCRAGYVICEKLKSLPEVRKAALVARLADVCRVSITPGTGKDLVLSWDEVREMSADGICFGAHTVSHPILTNVPVEHAKWEIATSRTDIEERIKTEVSAFSYPNGDLSPGIAKIVEESGFRCAVSVSPKKLISPRDNPYRLSRIAGLNVFAKSKVMLCGLWGDLRPTRVTSQGAYD